MILTKLIDLALAIRDDVLSVLTPTDGSPTNIRTDQYGNTWSSLGTKLDSVNDSVTADTELPSASTIAADAVTPTVPGLAAYNFIKTPGANTWDRLYSIVNATNSTGAGIAAVGNLAQFDDTSPTTITENQFGNLRMSATRELYTVDRPINGTALVPYAVRVTTNTTTTPTSATAYISSITITTEVLGTTSTVTIRDKQGTPFVLIPALTTVAVGLTTYNFQTPVKMTSGIDIITAGAVAATVDIWIDYYQ